MAELFEKTTIKGIELKNRLVRSATHEGMADANGFPNRELFNLYERLAKGGVGLLITGYSYVSRDGVRRNRGELRDRCGRWINPIGECTTRQQT